MKTSEIKNVLFVCMGNICRSPTAEGIFRARLSEALEDAVVEHDSCGTHDYHIGDAPDSRAMAHAKKRNIDIGDLRGRQVHPSDFEKYDLILAADHHNLSILKRLCPPEHQHKLHLMLEFSERYRGQEVPDPYYGGAAGFERVLDMLEDMADGLIDAIRASRTARGR